MKSIDIMNPYRKDSKIIKSFDLKHLGIISNSEENNTMSFGKIIGPQHASFYTAKDGTKKQVSLRSFYNMGKMRGLRDKHRVLVAKIILSWQRAGLAK